MQEKSASLLIGGFTKPNRTPSDATVSQTVTLTSVVTISGQPDRITRMALSRASANPTAPRTKVAEDTAVKLVGGIFKVFIAMKIMINCVHE